ncbi:MAG: imidazole glycerol phosphate synthase subunit HisH [Xanthobacteraceae bacterium]|nr:imidazole glycerol phosphate synthase subunit HisH [Xanthobacteraceae bacterium]
MPGVAIIDYGMGNVRSVKNAVECRGYDAVITADAAQIADASHIILPGVGAFESAMINLRRGNLIETLEGSVRRQGKPMLGICLGMQVLAKGSTEHAESRREHQGFGWFDADVVRIETVRADLKIPHMGWNNITKEREHPILANIGDKNLNFYFVHSYHMKCRNKADVVAFANYGVPVTAVVAKDNIVATQFHPEKSQDSGIELLGSFLSWNP